MDRLLESRQGLCGRAHFYGLWSNLLVSPLISADAVVAAAGVWRLGASGSAPACNPMARVLCGDAAAPDVGRQEPDAECVRCRQEWYHTPL